MSEIRDMLHDHRWDNPTVPEMKMMRNEAANHIQDMEESIFAFVRKNIGEEFTITTEEEALKWFFGYTKALEKGEEYDPKAEALAELEIFLKQNGMSLDDLGEGNAPKKN